MKRSIFGSAVLLATTALVGSGVVAVATASAATPAVGAKQNVIVLLRNQHSNLPAVKATMARRATALQSDQSPVRSVITSLGGRTTHAYRTLNAVAATLPASAVASLQADPAVSMVVPDLLWKLPTPAANTASSKASPSSAATDAGLCPTNPAKPQLEPEALELTHTDSDVAGARTARSLGYDGTGVKVGYIADGVDIDQSDFIRADGTHVFTDYQDFSGDGTNSSTSGAEAFGDASSIGAQGRTTYDISQFVNPAHPLPTGCNIRVEGMAPGASLVGLKVFSNALLTAPTSTIIQAIDWAVNVDHVDILNESFGSNPYPDNATDPISAFNHDAVDAGVTVIASTGDAGSGNSAGTSSTDPWVIGVGASTSERVYAQQGAYGIQLGNGSYTSDQLSSLSSGGISQTRRVADLLAPGDLNWALCSDRLLADGTPQYAGCLDNNDNPTNLLVFGGTSESAPITSGAAALVVQAYRKAHSGVSPTPAQVRQILTGSADDTRLPAQLQGSGLLDSYRAVQLAANMGAPVKTGNAVTLDQTQVNSVGAPGTTVSRQVTVRNEGAGSQRLTASLRKVTQVISNQTKTVQLSGANPTATFLDSFGTPRSYTETSFTVPPGADRLATTVSWGGPTGTIVRISLLDPHGAYAGYSLPQGTGNFGRLELHTPAAGKWTAILWTGASSAGYVGPVDFTATSYRASSAGTVSPASFTLPKNGTKTVTVSSTVPALGSAASSLVVTGRFGVSTVGSYVVQAVQSVHTGRTVSFGGKFVTGNGRSYGPAQADTYLFSLPAGAPALNIKVALPGALANEVVAHLSDPSGEPIATVVNVSNGTSSTLDQGLQILHAHPVPGTWQLTLELTNPAAVIPQSYTGTVSLTPAAFTVHGVPTSTKTTLARGKTVTQQVTIHNTGPAPQTYFVDARGTGSKTYPLVAAQAASTDDPFTAAIDLPLQSEGVPAWLVPTESTRLTVGVSASKPLTFDLMPLDSPTAINAPNNPDTESTTGTSASAVHLGNPLGSLLWAAFPTLIGPAPADGAAAVPSTALATVDTKPFYGDYVASTGDPLLGTVSATAPAATPVTVPAGGTVTVTVALTPTAAVGSMQKGVLDIDTLPPLGFDGLSGYADVAASVPFAFTVGH